MSDDLTIPSTPGISPASVRRAIFEVWGDQVCAPNLTEWPETFRKLTTATRTRGSDKHFSDFGARFEHAVVALIAAYRDGVPEDVADTIFAAFPMLNAVHRAELAERLAALAAEATA
jgi:hypothetical protein